MDKERKTILIADNVPDEISLLEGILKGEYQVQVVKSGKDALTMARTGTPLDLVLLDITMPDMDGFEICRELKEDSAGAAIPVIFLTAKIMTAEEKLGFELGAVDYIRKPVDPEVVKSRIRLQLARKDELLRASEVRYRRLFETARDGIMIVDIESGRVVDVNPALSRLMGHSQEDFLGKKSSELGFLAAIQAWQASEAEKGDRESGGYRHIPLETIDGRSIYAEFMTSDYRVNGRDLMQLSLRETTQLVEAERERDELSSRLSHYLSTSPTVTYSLALERGKVSWQWVSENVRLLLGYTKEEALAPDWWFRNIHAADRARVLDIVSELSTRETASREYRFSRKDRSLVWLHDEMRLIPGHGTEAEIVGTLTDISERKKAEEELNLKSSALEVAANAVVITDRKGIIRWVNPAFCLLSGYSKEEAIGKTPGELVKSGRQSAEFYRELWDTILSGKVWRGKIVNRRKSGEEYTEDLTITPVLDDSRVIGHFIAVKNDITERIAALEGLEAALREKDELLREIHHRVKNNMQVIISLLNISSNDIPDAALRGKLEDITRRMHAMAIIHEQFYEAKDRSRIDFAIYLAQLLERIGGEFPVNAKNAVLSCERGKALLNLEQAIPAGLIVEELLTNALKFAYAGRKESGSIRLTQTYAEGGWLAIEVRDEGVGLPPGIDPSSAETLGMQLIRILAEQLGGAVEFHRARGTVATLKFRIEPPLARSPRPELGEGGP